MHVCMHVYMHECMHVCMHVYVYVCVRVCVHDEDNPFCRLVNQFYHYKFQEKSSWR